MLALHKELPKASTPHEKTALQRRIEATDGQIDGGPAARAARGGDQDCERRGMKCMNISFHRGHVARLAQSIRQLSQEEARAKGWWKF